MPRFLLVNIGFILACTLQAQPDIDEWKILVDDRCAFPDFRLLRVANPSLLPANPNPQLASRIPAPDALEEAFAPWSVLSEMEQDAMSAHRENGMKRWQHITALDDLYGPDIRTLLLHEGLPASFGFLPLLITGYDPTYVGPGNRAGLWGLTEQDARSLGLRIDSNIDERMIPERSTRAAISYLRQLRARFPGADHKVAVAFIKGPSFATSWSGKPGNDALLDEWIALYRVVVRMQFNLEHPSVRFAWMDFMATWQPATCTSSPIGRAQLEALLGMDRRSQATFFPWWMGDSLDCVLLTRYPISIPPLFSQHWHRLQRDDFHMIPPQPISSNGAARQKHVTRRGDTLHTVARKYGITPTELQQWNALKSGTLRPGLSLHVSPPPRQAANPAPQQVHARQPAVASSVNVRIHVVKSGETVYAISRQYPGTTPEAILRINSIQGPILPGQKLKIPSTPN